MQCNCNCKFLIDLSIASVMKHVVSICRQRQTYIFLYENGTGGHDAVNITRFRFERVQSARHSPFNNFIHNTYSIVYYIYIGSLAVMHFTCDEELQPIENDQSARNQSWIARVLPTVKTKHRS